jgi:hypothetical protein
MPVEKKPEKINPMLKMMLRQFVPVIREKLQAISPTIEKTIAEVQLQPGEEYAAYMVAMNGPDAMVLTATFTPDNKLSRMINSQPASVFIENLINNI